MTKPTKPQSVDEILDIFEPVKVEIDAPEPSLATVMEQLPNDLLFIAMKEQAKAQLIELVESVVDEVYPKIFNGKELVRYNDRFIQALIEVIKGEK